MNALLSALAAIIAPAEAYLEQKLESIGAALLAGLGVIFNGFTNDQRAIFAQAIAYWQAAYAKAIAVAGTSTIDAIEQASSATLNEFVGAEEAEAQKEISAIVALLESSVKNSFGL